MHFYEVEKRWHQSPTRRVYAWNAVDVPMNGLLQHGHVIGLEDTADAAPRLIVDFACPAQNAVLVEWGTVFACSDQRGAEEQWTNQLLTAKNQFCSDPADVQLLLRTHPGGPWAWFPGKLLIAGFEPHAENNTEARHYALVEVLLAGQRIREILPRSQIRVPPSEEELQRRVLKPGHFVHRTCTASAEYWAHPWPHRRRWFRYALEERHRLRWLSFVDNEITFLQRTTESPVVDADTWNE
ncbi:uncharacterized protein LOC129598179 isoform X1 [Paramacrobiotus metropolitanus]|uniref:uncharacterized protein LOC129598179 isoform X1 n=1 Tax=Paramacrobiotus metropolitanus TaxID=2943436 RepID=UPI002445A1AD|nr:uncharacterized protein LOC129598179 isoform X1 [Paramacrobiotus metropolitanus]